MTPELEREFTESLCALARTMRDIPLMPDWELRCARARNELLRPLFKRLAAEAERYRHIRTRIGIHSAGVIAESIPDSPEYYLPHVDRIFDKAIDKAREAGQ